LLKKIIIMIALFGNNPILAKSFTNSIGMKFILIPKGSLVIDKKYSKCLKKTLDIKSFYMATTEVTQEQYFQIMGENPSEFNNERLNYDSRNNPVESVSWYNAYDFVDKLNKKEKTNKYRLPTEAEWEYAARANNDSKLDFITHQNRLENYAWYGANSKDRTYPVRKKRANRWGLYDMYGNVSEWCEDWYIDEYCAIPKDGTANYFGEKIYKVSRGGSWVDYAININSSLCDYFEPTLRSNFNGFRIVLDR